MKRIIKTSGLYALVMSTALVITLLICWAGLSWLLCGCDDDDWNPFPSAPSPTPIPAFGTVIRELPATHPGIGSVDVVQGNLWEYCQGYAELRKRDQAGDLQEVVPLDGRLDILWAVAWNPLQECFYGTNPECQRIDWNLIQISRQGTVLGGFKMMGGSSSNWIRNYDIEFNVDFTAGPAGKYEILAGQMLLESIHFSLVKYEFDDVSKPNAYYEAWWGKFDIYSRANTRTGNTFWAACQEDFFENGQRPIVEYYFIPPGGSVGTPKDVLKRTGRKITIPGVWFPSIIAVGNSMWGKGIGPDGSTSIYQISLGPD